MENKKMEIKAKIQSKKGFFIVNAIYLYLGHKQKNTSNILSIGWIAENPSAALLKGKIAVH